MVLYSEASSEMYKQLHLLAKAAQGRAKKQKLQHHNFVNNADAVPRFLGSSLNAVHQAVESYVPSMSVSKCACEPLVLMIAACKFVALLACHMVCCS